MKRWRAPSRSHAPAVKAAKNTIWVTLRSGKPGTRFTRPYTPRTNGKAERFIQTALREWAYALTYQNSLERQQQLENWLHEYNLHRPHASLKLNSPASRSRLNRNNLLRLHS